METDVVVWGLRSSWPIIPDCAGFCENFSDQSPAIFAAEEAIQANANVARRREFARGRACAHRAIEQLGQQCEPILTGSGQEPLWPTGIVGSITHCPGYCAAVAAPVHELQTIGIDAEPNRALPKDVLKYIANATETRMVSILQSRRPLIAWDTLLFCAKESVYKAWYSLTGNSLLLTDLVVQLSWAQQRFCCGPGPGMLHEHLPVEQFEGSWTVHGQWLVTLVSHRPAKR